jgi:glycosyltransferase involved in cell wall biosynthesis
VTGAAPQSDVCLIVEGGYPYIVGGVASWMDALIRASPGLKFHIIAISIGSQPRVKKFVLPENVVGLTDVILDSCPIGRTASARDAHTISQAVQLIQTVLSGDVGTSFEKLIDLVRQTGFGQSALLDSRAAWTAMERVYKEVLPDGPLIDFFWSWRFLARSLLAIVSAQLPDTRVFHAVSTGYAGLVGAYAKHITKRPYVVTEHGIYTNERRIELSVSEWIYDAGTGGFSIGDSNRPARLSDLWLAAFINFSRVSYALADVITTQYGANQDYQRADGAPEDKFRIIPNGIDVDLYANVRRSTDPRPPTVLMIGRIVPIKDTRTFIVAVSLLKELVPNVSAILIGPEEEDPAYAEGCRALVAQLGLSETVQFLGRVPDVAEYLGRADVIALTSISEAQPIALLEASATGLPAVTTDVGSCRDIIEGFAGDPVVGHGGIVVDACNPKTTAQALATILLDDELRAEMGRVMRERVTHLYNKERITKLYENLYASLADNTQTEAVQGTYQPDPGKTPSSKVRGFADRIRAGRSAVLAPLRPFARFRGDRAGA